MLMACNNDTGLLQMRVEILLSKRRHKMSNGRSIFTIGGLHSFDVSRPRDQGRRCRLRKVEADFDRPLTQDRVCRIAPIGPVAWSSANPWWLPHIPLGFRWPSISAPCLPFCLDPFWTTQGPPRLEHRDDLVMKREGSWWDVGLTRFPVRLTMRTKHTLPTHCQLTQHDVPGTHCIQIAGSWKASTRISTDSG